MAVASAIRPNLSAEVAERVRSCIIDGSLGPGERINEVHLAAELDISRTPLREALSRLASEGFVTVSPRRGFFVAELDTERFRQIYAIRAILDPSALELGGLPPRATVDALDRLNGRIRAVTGSSSRAIELDDRWHLLLVDHCPNRVLLELIVQFMQRTRPYEHAYMRQAGGTAAAFHEHEEILRRLRRRDLRGAVSALRRNMTSAVPSIIRWLERQATGRGGTDPADPGAPRRRR